MRIESRTPLAALGPPKERLHKIDHVVTLMIHMDRDELGRMTALAEEIARRQREDGGK